MAKIEWHREVQEPIRDGWVLCFQSITIHHEDGKQEKGYRFIYRRPDGTLQGRGAARIPDLETLNRITNRAQSEGWFI